MNRLIGLLALMLVFPLVFAKDKSDDEKSKFLFITEAFVTFDNQDAASPCVQGDDTITLKGTNFDNGDCPIVMLGGMGQLEICDYSASQILVRCPPDPYSEGLGKCQDGDYRLIVDTNKGNQGYSEFVLTIGAVGPKGEKGEKGDKGDKGDPGPPGPPGPGVGSTIVTQTLGSPLGFGESCNSQQFGITVQNTSEIVVDNIFWEGPGVAWFENIQYTVYPFLDKVDIQVLYDFCPIPIYAHQSWDMMFYLAYHRKGGEPEGRFRARQRLNSHGNICFPVYECSDQSLVFTGEGITETGNVDIDWVAGDQYADVTFIKHKFIPPAAPGLPPSLHIGYKICTAPCRGSLNRSRSPRHPPAVR